MDSLQTQDVSDAIRVRTFMECSRLLHKCRKCVPAANYKQTDQDQDEIDRQIILYNISLSNVFVLKMIRNNKILHIHATSH